MRTQPSSCEISVKNGYGYSFAVKKVKSSPSPVSLGESAPGAIQSILCQEGSMEKERILLVEDHPVNRALIVKLLSDAYECVRQVESA